MIDGIFGKSPVRGKAVGPMPFLEVAIVEACGVFTHDAVSASHATLVDLNRNPVAHLKLIDRFP